MVEFKVGDKVKVVNTDNEDIELKRELASHIGKTGKIDKDYGGGKFGFTDDNGRMGPAFKSASLESLEKKKPLPFTRSNNKVLTIIANGKSYTVAEDHSNYKKISQAIVDGDASELDDLVNPVKSVVKFASVLGVEVKDGVLHKDGVPLHGVIADKIISLHKDGLPIEPLVKFYNNLMDNPSKRAVEELYPFLESKGLPITFDGHFLAYKRVKENFTDCHSGKIDNCVGKVVEVVRNTVDDDAKRGCSYGLHCGNLDYVRNFNPGLPVVIVKVNPKDVVSVPYEDHRKIRCCRYEVLSEYDRDMIIPMPDVLHDDVGNPYNVLDDDDYWDDWDDEEDEDL